MGKSGPYGYDPFQAGQAWDPNKATANMHNMCRSLVDAWLRQCCSAPGSESMAALQVSEGQNPSVLDLAQGWQQAEKAVAQPKSNTLAAAAPRLWPFGPGAASSIPAGPQKFDQARLGQEPHQLPEGEMCRRMLDEYIYKCDFALM